MNEFDTSRITNIRSAAITEYKLVSDTVARVIATFVGSMSAEQASDKVAAVLEGKARPIKASFRWLDEGRVAIGYVAVARQVRPFVENATGYRKMTANLFMDSADESLWELKPGQGGKYLARQGMDNLGELIESSRVLPRGSVPKMNSIMSASVNKDQFVAFVDVTSAMMDYGFCFDEKDGKYRVVSSTTNQEVTIGEDVIAGVYGVDIPSNIQSTVRANKKNVTAADRHDPKLTSAEYYKLAYVYAPDYIEKVIKQVNEMAAL